MERVAEQNRTINSRATKGLAGIDKVICNGAERDRDELLLDLLERLEAAYDSWLAGGLRALHAELSSRDALAGRQVTVDGRSGRALGIDEEGRLVLDSGSVESGEVSLLS